MNNEAATCLLCNKAFYLSYTKRKLFMLECSHIQCLQCLFTLVTDIEPLSPTCKECDIKITKIDREKIISLYHHHIQSNNIVTSTLTFASCISCKQMLISLDTKNNVYPSCGCIYHRFCFISKMQNSSPDWKCCKCLKKFNELDVELLKVAKLYSS
jgi:hypothetical protein